jgi:tRNA threonylcarbamoyl adenosine modification protein (Sua5/YciO/YrdC/YwlC family)
VQVLRKGGLAIIPTDSIYAIVGDLHHRGVMEKICKLLDKKPNKANLSILCKDLSNLSEYTSPISNPTYKVMNRVLPGPFTFILKANNNVPKIFRQNKKTIGIRVPDNAICQALIAELGNPLVCSSIHSEDEIQEYLTEPEEIFEVWQNKVEYIIDGEAGSNIGTTVIDASDDELILVREGLGIDQL